MNFYNILLFKKIYMNIPISIICILNFLITFYSCQSPIKLSFESKLPIGVETSYFLSNYYNQYLFTKIKIGSENQNLELSIKLNRYVSYIIGSENSELKSEYFNEKNSKSYKQISTKEYESNEDEFFSSYKSEDNIYFGENLFFKNFIFFLSQKKQIFDESGHIGLKMMPSFIDKNNFIGTSFISQLKSNNIINSQYFYFIYNTLNENEFKYDGNLIIGAAPHQIEENDLFQEKNFHEIYAKIDENYNSRWNIKFTKVNYGGENLDISDLCEFSTTFGLIIAPINFFLIYEKFFENKDCYGEYNGEDELKNFMYLFCDENVDISEFKDVEFLTEDKDIYFVLTYKDLFRKIGKYNYFLILFNKDINQWTFGHIFLNKYTIVFNAEKKTIGYYREINNDSNDNKKNNYGVFIALSITFFIIIVGLIVYIFYFSPRNRKIRPNELEEKFDYSPQDNNKLGI